MAEHAKRRIRMQVRATPEEGEGTFVAKVSTFNLEYDIGWSWTEKILPGCFDASITAHPTIPIFYNHNWDGAPIGSGRPTASDTDLTVAGKVYLGQGDLVQRVWQAMLDEALEEWSIGFWPDQITWDSDNPECDTIVTGDLAEASICVRGANPETGTLELNARRSVWIEGDKRAREREFSRLRSMAADLAGPRRRADSGGNTDDGDDDEQTPGELAQAVDALIDQIKVLLEDGDTKGALDLALAADVTVDELLEAMGVPDDDDIEETESRAMLVALRAARLRAGHTHEHKHGAEVHSHAHTHSGGSYEHDASDPEVAHTHAHPDDEAGTDPEDPGEDESSRVLGSPWMRDVYGALSR